MQSRREGAKFFEAGRDEDACSCQELLGRKGTLRRTGEIKGWVEREMRSVKGFVSYTLARSADGGFSMTICQDKAGAEA
jgi:hypothetical protein